MRTLTLEERDLVSGGCDCGWQAEQWLGQWQPARTWQLASAQQG